MNRVPVRLAKLGDTCYIYSPIFPFIYFALKDIDPSIMLKAESIQEFIRNIADEFHESYTYVKSYEEKRTVKLILSKNTAIKMAV